MTTFYIFISTFALVFALGFQSLNVNNGHYIAAFFTSFGIIASMWAHRRWMKKPPKTANRQPRIAADELNKRAEVESILLNVYAGKRPTLTQEECKALAFRLGVPTEFQRPEWRAPSGDIEAHQTLQQFARAEA